MEIARLENGDFSISELEPALAGILLALPKATDPGDDGSAAWKRLYPEPSSAPEEAVLCEEWQEFVVPDLKEFFEDSTEKARRDMAPLESGATGYNIPVQNVDAWINALNQGRIALAARFDVTEAEMERPISHVLENERELALFQIKFYEFLQTCLIHGVESEEG